MDSLGQSRSFAALAARTRRALAHPAARFCGLAVVAVAAVWRDPSLFRSPRFWAEEGTNYFASALRGGWFGALVRPTTTSYAAYLNPVPHFATFAAARFGKLEWAPTVTTTVWCLFFTALEICVLYGRARLLDGPGRRALALSVPLIVTNNGENWMNTVGTHYVCDLAILLLLLEAPEVSGRRKRVSVAAAGVFALASQTNWLLFPAAAFLFFRDRESYAPYVRVLGIAAFVHLTAALLFHVPGARPPNDYVAVPHILFLKLVVWPFAGWDRADVYGSFARALDPASFRISAVAVSVNLGALAVAALATMRRDRVTIALASAYATSVVAYSILGLDIGRGHLSAYNGGRYAWLPNSIALLLIGHQVDFSKGRILGWRNASYAALLATAVFVGILDFRHSKVPHGPSWRREIRHFRQDPKYHQLRIAPAGWSVDVPSELARRQ